MFTTEKACPLAVIVDLDDTLAKATSERAKNIPKDKANATSQEWDKFMEGIERDRPVPLLRSLVMNLFMEYDLILVTSREEKLREITEEWLYNNGIKYDELHMRPNGDKSFPWDLKEELFLDKISQKYEVVMAIDDEDRTCKMFEKHGITTLQPRIV